MCLTDADCPGPTVCLSTASWWNSSTPQPVAVLANGTTAPLGCVCSTWYGNEGADCAGYDTATARLFLAAGIINAFMCAAPLVSVSVDLGQLVWARMASVHDAVTMTLAQLSAGMALLCVSQMLTAATPFYPEQWVIFDEQKASFLHPALRGCFLVGGLFGFMAAVSIAVWWIDIVSRSNRLALARFSVFRTPLLCLEGAFFLCVIIPYATVGDTYASLVVIPFLVVMLVLYVLGARAFSNALAGTVQGGTASRSDLAAPTSPALPPPDSPTRDATPASQQIGSGGLTHTAPKAARNAYARVLRRIIVTSSLITFWLTCDIIVLVAEGTLSAEGWRSTAGPPSASSAPALIVLYQLIPTFICCIAWPVARSSHENVRLRVARSTRRGFGPCARSVVPGAAGASSSAPDTSRNQGHRVASAPLDQSNAAAAAAAGSSGTHGADSSSQQKRGKGWQRGAHGAVGADEKGGVVAAVAASSSYADV